MGLAEYRRKRNFKATPEPSGHVADERRDRGRMFVVQKHAATRLHYDFRLELEGVLKSWAIPKGPSLDPTDKRLAMHVEDHPIEYGDFEGIIPKGQYGGGTVVLWDRGTWEPIGDPHKAYHAGSLKFTLRGTKLRGGWALVRIGARRNAGDERSWLLIKERDEHARPGGARPIVESEPKSVATGRSLEEIATAEDRVWHSNRNGQGEPPKPDTIPGARRAKLPASVSPQLATLVKAPPTADGWLHEMKYDGYRILARLDRGQARLFSRNGRDWTTTFPTIAAALERLPAKQAMVDGEVAVLQPDGTTSFQALQNLLSGTRTGQLVYLMFDLVHLDGWDLSGARLEDRKAALQSLFAATSDRAAVLRYSDHVVGEGAEFFAHACRLGLEGIVSKRRDAPYRSTRGADWLKVKCLKQQEVVIGGYTDPEGSRVGIGALLGGVYEDGNLVYAGKIGTGFDNRVLRDLKTRLTALEQASPPFAERPQGVGRAHWVKPELVAQVSFSEWTDDGRLRHPAFQGLRDDKPATSVVRERPSTVEDVVERRPSPSPSRRAAKPRAKTAAPAPAKRAVSAAKPALASGREAVVAGVRITHADRVLYPPQGTTKRELALFYESIAEWILPHLAGRPTTLVRCPEGAHKTCFYQKHTGSWAPDSLRRVKIQEKRKTGEYLVVDSVAALVGLVQIGILEIHTWNSVVERLEQPDRIVLDLDPGPGVPWKRVVECARLVRDELAAHKLQSFVKTTGGKGLHVVAPLVPGPSWEEASAFARAVAERLTGTDPRGYTARMAKTERPGKIFIDYLRNVRGATSVAAYSTRATPRATVSVPIGWDELTPSLTSDHFTIANLPRRLAGLDADPWAGYWTARQGL
jgi:bifunctional non-homologous end joining protein LigD